MGYTEPCIELEGVSGVFLDSDGKCIITLRSSEYIDKIESLKMIITLLNDKINSIEKRIADDNKYKKARIADINNTLITERFDGIMQNMDSMRNAILDEQKK